MNRWCQTNSSIPFHTKQARDEKESSRLRAEFDYEREQMADFTIFIASFRSSFSALVISVLKVHTNPLIKSCPELMPQFKICS
jgi:hypothetical protein